MVLNVLWEMRDVVGLDVRLAMGMRAMCTGKSSTFGNIKLLYWLAR